MNPAPHGAPAALLSGMPTSALGPRKPEGDLLAFTLGASDPPELGGGTPGWLRLEGLTQGRPRAAAVGGERDGHNADGDETETEASGASMTRTATGWASSNTSVLADENETVDETPL